MSMLQVFWQNLAENDELPKNLIEGNSGVIRGGQNFVDTTENLNLVEIILGIIS